MRRMKYTELQAEYERVNRLNGLLCIALTLSMAGKPDVTETARHDGQTWTYRLYGATRADGGIVLETYATRGQRPHTVCHYLDALASARVVYGDLSTEAYRIRTAVTALVAARDRALREQTETRPAEQA